MNQAGSAKLAGIYYKPLMTTSYAVLWGLFGNDPTPFHIFQVALHSTNAFLFFLLLLNFVSAGPAFLLALLFLLHPTNTENAVYVANYQDVLFTFFGLSALNIVVKRNTSWLATIGVALLLLCSLLSKESGVLFLAASFFYVCIFQFRNRFRFLFALMGTVLSYAFLRFGLAGLYGVTHGVAPISRVSVLERFLTMPAALTHYFIEFIAPIHLTTTQNWIITNADEWFWLPLFFLVSVMCALAWALKKNRSKPLLFFSLCLAAGLFLHSQLLAPLDGTVADRWFYFPMLALLGIFAVLVPWSRWSMRQISIVLVPILVLLGARSMARSLNWADGFTLYKHDLEIAPDAYDIQNNYGVELFRHGEIKDSYEHFKRSTELAPQWTINWNNLGAVQEKFGQLREAEYSYCRSVENGIYYLAFENYPSLLVRVEKPKEALTFIEQMGLIALPGNEKLLTLQKYLREKGIAPSTQTLSINCVQ